MYSMYLAGSFPHCFVSELSKNVNNMMHKTLSFLIFTLGLLFF